MRIVFAGSPAIAVPCLEALANEFEVVGVLTNPDRKKGRGKKLLPTEVKTKAVELGIPVLQFDHLYAEAREAVRSLEPDLLVSFAFGRIFGPKFLAVFPEGGLNVHPSLLPKYRGATPIPAAIRAGDEETGITVQRISPGMDEGDILEVLRFPLEGTETTESLSAYVSLQSPDVLCRAVRSLVDGTAVPQAQNPDGATYCSFIQKSDALIDWGQSAGSISCMVRAYYPWPKAFTSYQGNTLMLSDVHEFTDEIPGITVDGSTRPGTVLGAVAGHGVIIAAGSGLLGVGRLQLQSKKELDWKSFINGNPGLIGAELGV